MKRRPIEKPTSTKSQEIPKTNSVSNKAESPIQLGLPTFEAVNKRLEEVSSPLVIRDHNSFSDESFGFPASTETPKFGSDKYSQFQKEFLEDLEDFELRIQRLKMRILRQYLAGILLRPDEEDLSYSDRKKTFGGKIIDSVGNISNQVKKDGANNKARQELIDTINKAIPTELHLSPLKNTSEYDAEEIWETTLKLMYANPPDSKQKELLASMIVDIQRIESQIYSIENQGELFPQIQNINIGEAKYRDLWNDYRRLLKQIANFEELESWFSPTYGQSGKGQRGKEQSPEAGRTDYQRFMMPEIQVLERRLQNSHFGEREFEEYFESYLFEGGLAALQGILIAIDSEIEQVDSVKIKPKKLKVFTSNFYFETDKLIKDHYAARPVDLVNIDTSNVNALAKRIKKERPIAVFIAPIANDFEMHVTEIKELIELLKNESGWDIEKRKPFAREDKTYIIIDDSVSSRLANWRNLGFRGLPNFLKIMAFESLVKYGEDGQELAQAGLVTTIGEYADSNLFSARSRHGLMPPENTVRKLYGIVPGDLAEKKMVRHSRNAKIIAEELEKMTKEPESFIKHIVYAGSQSHPDHDKASSELSGGGGLISIDFDPRSFVNYQEQKYGYLDKPIDEFHLPEKSRNIGAAFDKLVLKLAQEAGLEINQGTSYGFNTTRMALYQRPDKDRINYYSYIRLAAGTENIKDVTLLVSILKRANEIFSKAKKEKRLLALSEALLSNKTQLLRESLA